MIEGERFELRVTGPLGCGSGAEKMIDQIRTWSTAWRYASTGFSGGDLITVTEHGWYDFMTKHADHRPALVLA